MAGALVAAVYLILCSALTLSGRLTEGVETCTPDSDNPCKCNVAGGEFVDLTKLFQNGPLSVTDKAKGYTYNVDACKGVDCAGKCEDGKCVGCQTKGPDAYGLASLKDAEFNLAGSAGSWVLTAIYKKGQEDRIMMVQFDYKQGAKPSVVYNKEDPSKTYHLTVTGEYDVVRTTPSSTPATGKGVDPGIVGIVLIVLLLAAIVAYIVIGIIINATVRGARGVEMIPNLSFWKDFPFLLKDGVIFTFTCPCLRNSTTGYAKL